MPTTRTPPAEARGHGAPTPDALGVWQAGAFASLAARRARTFPYSAELPLELTDDPAAARAAIARARLNAAGDPNAGD